MENTSVNFVNSTS